jgi:hypothetical protein
MNKADHFLWIVHASSLGALSNWRVGTAAVVVLFGLGIYSVVGDRTLTGGNTVYDFMKADEATQSVFIQYPTKLCYARECRWSAQPLAVNAAGPKSLSETAQEAHERLGKPSDRAGSQELGAFPSSTAIARQSPKLRRE